MITQAAPSKSTDKAGPTLWGLTPIQLHDRFWAARGVQVVRLGEPSEIVDGAELFLLTESRTLAVFKLTRIVEMLSWLKPDVLLVRIHDDRERGYRERALVGPDGGFLRFERTYGDLDSRQARVALTPERRIAQLWQKSPDARFGWGTIREEVPRGRRGVVSIRGSVYNRSSDADVAQCVREIVQVWKQPGSTILRARKLAGSAWTDQTTQVLAQTRFVGSVWVGAGRQVAARSSIIGPCVLWDDPAARPPVDTLRWHEIEPALNFERPIRPVQRTSFSRFTKRLFDMAFAAVALLLTLPLYPFVMLAIWLEDGRPFFFAHRREALNGREFPCLKFRSMRRDADRIKQELAEVNQADGPQFFIENDPRMTAVGRFIRKTYIDELPQFWNVLLGHMSIVGPRPSPFKENQYCPPWREARLSVRPGVTGLWQIKRTRVRGTDFQEWIRYDIEYVENESWSLDLKILWGTVRVLLRGVLQRW